MFSARIPSILSFTLLFLAAPRLLAQADKAEKPADDEKKTPLVDEKKALDEKKATEDLLQKAENEYRLFFKRPEKVIEFWAAIKYEVRVGKFDLAALHLKRLLELQPPGDVDKELLQIEEADGLSSFLRLQTVRKWSDFPPFEKEAEKNVNILINRITSALEKYLSDPQRMAKFINHLDAATPEERLYAFAQLDRARARAAPYLIKGLLENPGKPLHDRIADALVRLDAAIVPPLLEVLVARNAKDARFPDLRLTLLNVLKRRGDVRAVPYLWHLWRSPLYPPAVQARAGATLSYLLGTPPQNLPSAEVALTGLAEKYYHHRVKFADPKRVNVWPWNGSSLARAPVTLSAAQAEEYFGLRYARQALDLDPAYKPAQIVYLDLMLDHNYAPELDQVFLKKMPANLERLLATVDSGLLIATLNRALDQHDTRVVLATVTALGERGETRAARPASGGAPQGIARALFYPDRRVQFAAARALIRMPNAVAPVASDRVVDILRRFVVADAAPKALVAFIPPAQAAATRKSVQAAGYTPVFAATTREAMAQLNKSADFDVILVSSHLPPGEFLFALAQLRQDRNSGRLPLIIFEDKNLPENPPRLAARYPNTWIVPAIVATLPADLKGTIDRGMKDTGIVSLSPKERKEFSRVALDLLWHMARGETPGYRVRPVQEALVQALRSDEQAPQALDILARLPGADNQQRLANVVLDPARGKLRLAAARALNRHIQTHGVLLSNLQIRDLKAQYGNTMENPELRTQLALVIGSMRQSAAQTGGRLIEFEPGGKQ